MVATSDLGAAPRVVAPFSLTDSRRIEERVRNVTAHLERGGNVRAQTALRIQTRLSKKS